MFMNAKRIKEFTDKFYADHQGQLPMSELQARQIRGIGSFGIRQLVAAGYVYGFRYGTLSVRAINVLSRMGIINKEDAKAAIKDGRLNPIAKHRDTWNHPSRNYGLKTHKEVCEWAGVEYKVTTKSRKVCPHCGGEI